MGLLGPKPNFWDPKLLLIPEKNHVQSTLMVSHGLLYCKLKNYSDGARMLMDSYLNGGTQFVRCGEKESSWRVVLFVSYILMTFRGLLSTAGFIFMRMISRFITVLVFRIYEGVMMRSTWICNRYMSGQRLMDWNWIRKRAMQNWYISPPTLLISVNVVKVVPRVSLFWMKGLRCVRIIHIFF
jgi:hypothetical protein